MNVKVAKTMLLWVRIWQGKVRQKSERQGSKGNIALGLGYGRIK